MLKSLFPLMLLSINVAPAHAQDGSESTGVRTKENAQRFLTEIFSQGGNKGRFNAFSASWENGLPKNGQWRVSLDQVNREQGFPGGAITSMAATGPCTTLVQFSELKAVDVLTGAPIMLRDGSQTVYSIPLNYNIDWSQVIQVGSAGSPPPFVQVLFRAEHANFQSWHPTAEEASRVAFAMEFLRNACAPSSDTGF